MDLSIDSIIGKIEDHAMLISWFAGAYDRYPDLGLIFNQYTNPNGALTELKRTLSNMGLLKFKLLDSPHLYTAEVKYGAIAWLAAELGLIPKKYQKLAEKVVIGGAAAALTMPASGEGFTPSGSGSNSGVRGI